MPNSTIYYPNIRFDFWSGPPVTVDNEYISDFCLHNVRQDWCWFQWNDYHIRSECEGCYFVFRPVVCQDNNLSLSKELREHLKHDFVEFLERLRTPDLWSVTITDGDGTRHPVRLPVSNQHNEYDGTLTNELQTVHFAENGWTYLILGSKEYTEQCIRRLAWVSDARPDGQVTIMECEEKAKCIRN